MFYGYAICHETETIYGFESDYSTLKSVERNLERCIQLAANVEVTIDHKDFFAWRADKVPADMEERMEETAKDSVSSKEGVDSGYEIFPERVMVSKDSRKEELAEELTRELTPEEQLEELSQFAKETEGECIIRMNPYNVWIYGDTRKYKDWLKRCGCKYARKRKAWYWRIPKAA